MTVVEIHPPLEKGALNLRRALKVNRIKMYSDLGESLSSTNTCWHPLHQVPLVTPSTCSFQYSWLHRDTTSKLPMHFKTISQCGKHATKLFAITLRIYPTEVKGRNSTFRKKKISCSKETVRLLRVLVFAKYNETIFCGRSDVLPLFFCF